MRYDRRFRFLSRSLMKILLLLALAVCVVTPSFAAERVDPLPKIQSALVSAGIPVVEVTPSKISGLFDVRLSDGTTLLTDRTGTFFVVGDVYQRVNQRIVNLSDQRRMEDRKALLLTLEESEMVVFDSIAERKASITVFTDIDCGFCRKLHQEVPSLNQMGVAVRYLAYPRAGVGSDSFDKIVSAWCAPDPKRALTLAKSLQPIDAKTCDNPVSDHLQLGSRMGVTGTPAIVLDNGRLVPGYLPAERLAPELGLSAGS